MKSKFKIPTEFKKSTNESIVCIGNDEDKDYSITPPDRLMPLEEYKKLTRSEIVAWYKSEANDQYSIFYQHRLKQLAELDIVKEEWFNFLISPKSLVKRPIDILDMNLYFRVRLEKLRQILSPDKLSLVRIRHPKTGYEYWVARANDWNDKGEKKRSFSKSIIRADGENRVIKKLHEIYEDMGYEVKTNVPFFVDGGLVRIIADMVILKGSTAFAVEIKMNREKLAQFIVAESMWDAYKLKYKRSL